MVNISTVGRRASTELRKQYYEWDKENKERESIVSKLSYMYRDLEFSIGGDISIDIYPKGKDKSQVLHDMKGQSVFLEIDAVRVEEIMKYQSCLISPTVLKVQKKHIIYLVNILICPYSQPRFMRWLFLAI